jgi:hypothetical protein
VSDKATSDKAPESQALKDQPVLALVAVVGVLAGLLITVASRSK